MRQWSGGVVCEGLVEVYPLQPEDPEVVVSPSDVKRLLGIDLSAKEIAGILGRLQFETKIKGDTVYAVTPDHRLDIDTDPVNAKADVIEEIARIYGYENIPETRMADSLPPQRNNFDLEFEEKLRDILVNLGLQEVITYRLTSPEKENRRLGGELEPDPTPYVEVVNPIATDRHVMRKSVISSVLEIVEQNARFRERIAIFEIGYVYLASEEGILPDELPRLVLALTGPRDLPAWQGADRELFDFYDLKGILEKTLSGLHVSGISFQNHQHPVFHPGKCASIHVGERQIGVMGELHPAAHAQHNFSDAPVLGAILYLEVLQQEVPSRHEVSSVSPYPPVLEDIALVMDENIPAAEVEAMILQTGGKTVTEAQLFDIYRSDQIGAGKKSLAYNLTYQAPDRTLTDEEVAKVRNKIVKRLEREYNAQLRDDSSA
jgi:phenylalanyl-tRNA synthetase beta chain